MADEKYNEKYPLVQLRVKKYEFDELDKYAEPLGMNVNGFTQFIIRGIVNPQSTGHLELIKLFTILKKILLTGFN